MLLKRRKKLFRGQTALEYAFMTTILVGFGAFLTEMFLTGGKGVKKSPVKAIVSDAYGDEKRMGIIGRPYP